MRECWRGLAMRWRSGWWVRGDIKFEMGAGCGRDADPSVRLRVEGATMYAVNGDWWGRGASRYTIYSCRYGFDSKGKSAEGTSRYTI